MKRQKDEYLEWLRNEIENSSEKDLESMGRRVLAMTLMRGIAYPDYIDIADKKTVSVLKDVSYCLMGTPLTSALDAYNKFMKSDKKDKWEYICEWDAYGLYQLNELESSYKYDSKDYYSHLHKMYEVMFKEVAAEENWLSFKNTFKRWKYRFNEYVWMKIIRFLGIKK